MVYFTPDAGLFYTGQDGVFYTGPCATGQVCNDDMIWEHRNAFNLREARPFHLDTLGRSQCRICHYLRQERQSPFSQGQVARSSVYHNMIGTRFERVFLPSPLARALLI